MFQELRLINDRLQRELERTDSRYIRLKHWADEKRVQPTESEMLLLERPPDFVFKQPLLNFIIDFFNVETSLCVEIDGTYHWQQYRKDKSRDLRMYRKLGVYTLRVTSEEVLEDPDYMAQYILNWTPVAPSQLDDRPVDHQQTYRMNMAFDSLIKRWEPRPRKEVLADLEFLRIFTEVGYDAQEKFVKRLDDRAIYWPSEGYRT